VLYSLTECVNFGHRGDHFAVDFVLDELRDDGMAVASYGVSASSGTSRPGYVLTRWYSRLMDC